MRQALRKDCPVSQNSADSGLDHAAPRPPTWAVVVLHRADRTLLREQFDALTGQVDGVVYADNADGQAGLNEAGIATGDRPLDIDPASPSPDPAVELIGDGTNVGLAAALNRGLEAVGRRGATHALLLDQDSIPDADMVATLHRLLALGTGPGSGPTRPVAAIGPAIVDELHGRTDYFARLRLPLNQHIHPDSIDPGDPEAFEVDFLITSGTLLPLAVLDVVGYMDEDLFIDSVDFDWSFRAGAAGYALLATFSAQLRHRRGESLHRTPLGFSIRRHPAPRLTYMFRNRIRLYRRPYVLRAWKVHDFARMLLETTLLALFVPGRRANLSAIARGVRAGVRD